MPKTYINKEVERFIKKNRMVLSGTAIGKQLGIHKSVVNRYLRNNGLTPPMEVLNGFKKNRTKTSFTALQDETIRRDYMIKPIKVIANEMGRSYTGVIGRMKAMGLVLPKEVIEARKRNSKFPSGHVPDNKGKKMNEELKARLKHTFFNKGHKPANTLHDGAITTRHDRSTKRDYKWIRVNGTWEMLHVVIWKEKHGEVKPGKIIAFKDGNSLNCVIGNLEAITREDNMKRNSFHNYPEELKEFVLLKSKITRKVNQISKYGKE